METNNKRLAEIISPRDIYFETMQGMLEQMFPQIMEMMGGVEDDFSVMDEVGMTADEFVDAFRKEALWIYDSKYEEYIGLMQDCCDKVYTPEQQQILAEFYTANPWVIEEQKHVAVEVMGVMMTFGQSVAQQACANLEETKDI